MQDQDIINEDERHEAATETPIGEVKDVGEGEQRNVPLAHFPSGADGTEPGEGLKLVKRFAKTPHTVVWQMTLPSGRCLSAEWEAESTDHRAQAFLYDDDRCVCQIVFFDGYQSRNVCSAVVRNALHGLVSRCGHKCRYRANKAAKEGGAK